MKPLSYDEAVKALEQASHIVLISPYADIILASGKFLEEDTPDCSSHYRIAANGIDDVILEPGMTFEVTEDGEGFRVPGSRLSVFPQRACNLRKG